MMEHSGAQSTSPGQQFRGSFRDGNLVPGPEGLPGAPVT
jgi:hypothetical protein